MKKKFLTIVIMIAILCPWLGIRSQAAYIYDIQDVDRSAWYFTPVRYVVTEDLMTADENHNFRPLDPMTRAMFIQTLYSMAGSPKVEPGKLKLEDVADGAWYGDALRWAKEYKIVSFPGKKFRPEDAVTREEQADMVYRYALSRGEFGVYNNLTKGDLKEYKDAKKISKDKIPAMAWMTVNGFLQGNADEKVEPTREATRAETALLIARLQDSLFDPGCVDWTFVKSVNHGGYNLVAPINTLPAYEESARQGYEYVETDVRLTKDRVPVLLHGDVINEYARNDDGSEIKEEIRISEITYEEALKYDFGIWKGEEYAGTRLATFDQFIDLCKKLKLKPYVELKAETGLTFKDLQGLIDKVYEADMLEDVTWISYTTGYLDYVRNCYTQARLGLVVDEIYDKFLLQVKALKTDRNEVFLDSLEHDSSAVERCKAIGIPLEAWVVDDEEEVLAMDPYVSGITSDNLIADQLLPSMPEREVRSESKSRVFAGIGALLALALAVYGLIRFPPIPNRRRILRKYRRRLTQKLKAAGAKALQDAAHRPVPSGISVQRQRQPGSRKKISLPWKKKKTEPEKNEVFENPYL